MIFPSQALGLDDTRLVIPLIIIPVITGILFQGFAAQQVITNRDCHFGGLHEYDKCLVTGQHRFLRHL